MCRNGARHLKNWWTFYVGESESFYRGAAPGSDSGLAGQSEFLERCKRILWPETANSSGVSHIPSQPMSITSLRGMISRDSRLHLDTRNSLCTSGNVFESIPARCAPSSALSENPRNLASSSCGLRPIDTGKIAKHGEGATREPEDSTILTAWFSRNHSTWILLYHTGGAYSQNGIMENPRHPISEQHLGKFQDSVDFQCWQMKFETEVSANSPCPTVTM